MSTDIPRNTRAHAPPRPDWLALHSEDVLEPDLAIIDPHHHLWNRAGHRYFLEEFLEDVNTGHNIRASVFIDCRAMYRTDGDPARRPIGEVEFANGIAAMSASGDWGACRVADGIVGYADLGLGAPIRDVLEEMIRVGGGRFKGVRNISAWHPDPAARGSSAMPPEGLLTRPGFKDGFRVLGELGLSFDGFMYHTQLDEICDVARAVPNTTVILDHVGGPIGVGPYAGRRNEVLADWTRSMREVARNERVFVKLGGLGMRMFGFDVHERERPPTSETLASLWRPYIETCIEIFGVDRCMFQSNFPVDKGSCSYPVLWNAFKRIVSGATADEKAALFFGTAARAYRLRVPADAAQ